MEKPRPGWVTRTFWLTEQMAEALRVEAFRRRVSQAEVVREALAAVLPPAPKQPKPGKRPKS